MNKKLKTILIASTSVCGGVSVVGIGLMAGSTTYSKKIHKILPTDLKTDTNFEDRMVISSINLFLLVGSRYPKELNNYTVNLVYGVSPNNYKTQCEVSFSNEGKVVSIDDIVNAFPSVGSFRRTLELIRDGFIDFWKTLESKPFPELAKFVKEEKVKVQAKIDDYQHKLDTNTVPHEGGTPHEDTVDYYISDVANMKLHVLVYDGIIETGNIQETNNNNAIQNVENKAINDKNEADNKKLSEQRDSLLIPGAVLFSLFIVATIALTIYMFLPQIKSLFKK